MVRPAFFSGMIAATLLISFSAEPAAAKPPTNWDGLVQVPAKSVDYLYLRPGADFRQYNALILDPTQVAFRKNWHKDINRDRRGASHISDSDVRRAIDEAQGKLSGAFGKRFGETGFPIVAAPAPNALRVFVGIANVDVTAPDLNSSTRGRVYSEQAGHATLVVEVRDSLTGELLGRAVDLGVAGDHLVSWRNSTTNWADFEQLFDQWATISAKGFRKLIASSPQPAQ